MARTDPHGVSVAPAASRRLTGNTLILLANNVGSAGLAFLISVLVGRGLGAQGLGQYAFISAWLAPLISLADFGMGSLITRDVARDRAAALGTLRTATRALIPIAGIILLGAILAIPTLQLAPPVALALGITALLIILDPWYGLYTALFRALDRMWPILIINVGGFTIQLILTAIGLALGAGLIGVSAALITVNVLQLIGTAYYWRRLRQMLSITALNIPTISDQPSRVRAILRQAWPFALAAVLNALQLRLNVILLERLAGDIAVGQYSAANRFVEAGRLIPGALFGALFPALSSLAANPAAMNQTFLRAARFIMLFAIAFAISMTLFGGILIRVTYDPKGTSFGGSVPVLAVLAWALLPSLLRGTITLYLYSLGDEHFVNRVTLVALVAQAGIGWLLITQSGVIGGALTILITEGGTALWLAGRAFRFARRSR